MGFPKDFDNFLRGFIWPHEAAYAPGHDGDLNFVVTENVPGDEGGLTYLGVDQTSHPNVNVASLTPDTAEAIYWSDFIASQSPMLPGRLALYHYDCAVNLGPAAAIRILQDAIGVCVDGELGTQTLLAAWLGWQNSPATLLASLLDSRDAHYQALASANPSQVVFLAGWKNRVADLRAWKFPMTT